MSSFTTYWMSGQLSACWEEIWQLKKQNFLGAWEMLAVAIEHEQTIKDICAKHNELVLSHEVLLRKQAKIRYNLHVPQNSKENSIMTTSYDIKKSIRAAAKQLYTAVEAAKLPPFRIGQGMVAKNGRPMDLVGHILFMANLLPKENTYEADDAVAEALGLESAENLLPNDRAALDKLAQASDSFVKMAWSRRKPKLVAALHDFHTSFGY